MFFLKELPTKETIEKYKERFPQMNTQAVDDALKMLRRASLLLRELEAYFSSHGLSQSRFLAMIILDREHNDKGLSAKTLAGRLDISKPVVTNTLKSLEKDKYIIVMKNNMDGRAKWIKLTESGRQKLDDLLPGYFSIIDNAMSHSESRQ